MFLARHFTAYINPGACYLLFLASRQIPAIIPQKHSPGYYACSARIPLSPHAKSTGRYKPLMWSAICYVQQLCLRKIIRGDGQLIHKSCFFLRLMVS